jgi:aspartyl/asparaginyl beta-hydroxylase (cupin superfamily)
VERRARILVALRRAVNSRLRSGLPRIAAQPRPGSSSGTHISRRPESPIDRNALVKAGTAALQSGDARTARRHFEALLEGGQGDASVCMALAAACQRLGDATARQSAVDRALAFEPRNLQALLMKGDCLAMEGDMRGATSFYKVAVSLGSQSRNLPAPLVEALRRAAAAIQQTGAQVEGYLRRQLADAGYDATTSSSRFTQSLDLLTGRKRIYVQQPQAYYFPALPQVQFYPREMFPWLDEIEAATDDICTELTEVLRADAGFAPYLQTSANAPASSGGPLLDSLDWSAFFLYRDGQVVAENAPRCPRTMQALANVPFPRVTGRDPMALFSVLKPGVRIPPHNGFLNTRLICHLPLIVPPGCILRVGNEQREFRKGHAWVFDDSIEHEAFNPTSETRVILLFDIWRPELTDEERRLVAALLEAMDSFGTGPRVEWTA